MRRIQSALLLLSLLLPLLFAGCKTKTGCTNPDANNYDPKAEEDDGSCLFGAENLMIPANDTLKDEGLGTGDILLTADRNWYLEGPVFVNAGQIMRIEPGTVIQGLPGDEEDAARLVIARGGKLYAEGTASNPIIFTSADDDPDNQFDLPFGTRGLWGGIALLGNAPTNEPGNTAVVAGLPEEDPRWEYGGSNCNDNSGILKYVSIRYAGESLGFGDRAEGLIMAGVGDATQVDFVEIAFAEDDGLGLKGGCVNFHHLISVLNGDDAIDIDLGYNGKGQFLFVMMDDQVGDRAIEIDGAISPEDAQPYTLPNFWNSTFIGGDSATGSRTAYFKDNAGGQIHNSIFVEFDRGIFVEDLETDEDSYNRFLNGQIVLANNTFWNFAGNDSAKIFRAEFDYSPATPQDSLVVEEALQLDFYSRNNQLNDPGLSISRIPTGNLNPVPSPSISAPAPTDSWFQSAPYRGAFDGNNWMTGWTLLSAQGYF